MLGRQSCPTRAFSVQSKLLAAFVLLTVTGITVLTAVGYLTARQSLTASAERQLLGLQRSKAGIVKSMLTSMRNEVLAFSASDAVATAADVHAGRPSRSADGRRHARDDRGRDAVSPARSTVPPSPSTWRSRRPRAGRCPRAPRSGTSTTTTSCRRRSRTASRDCWRPSTDTSRYGARWPGSQAKLGPLMAGSGSTTSCSSVPTRSRSSTATRSRRFSAPTSPVARTPRATSPPWRAP